MDLSISIASWNTKELTKQCIESIFKTTKKISFEIIVIDNGSKDDSVKMLEGFGSKIKLIKNSENVGFGKAHNQAFRVSKGKYNLILNSDTILQPNSIEEMVKFLDENPEAAVVTCKLVGLNGANHTFIYPFPTITNQFLARVPFISGFFQKEKTYDYNKFQQVENFEGACYIVRRNIMEEMGFFDEDLFAYMEETTLFYQMKKKGAKLFFLPEAKVIHYGGASTKKWEQKHVWFYTNLLQFFGKNYGGNYALFVKALVSVSNLLELIRTPLALIPFYGLGKRQLGRTKLALSLLKINFFRKV